MAGTPEGARKAAETRRNKYGADWEKQKAAQAGKQSKRGGFASEKVGKDGLTGQERAKIYGSKGGQASSSNFKNDPERAKKLSHEYWEHNRKDRDEDTEVPS